MDLKIYEIPHELRIALEAVTIDEETGEIVGMDKVDALTESATLKVANVARYIRELENTIDGMKQVKATIDKRIKSAQKVVDFLATQSVRALLALPVPYSEKRIEEPDIKVSLRKTNFVELDGEDKLDEKFIEVTTVTTSRPNKTKIANAIKNGEEVKGARLCTNYTLQIK